MPGGAIYVDNRNKNAGVVGFLQNLLGGLMMQAQQQKEQQDLMSVANWARGGFQGQPPQMQTPRGQQMTQQFIQQLADPMNEGLLNLMRARQAEATAKKYEAEIETEKIPKVKTDVQELFDEETQRMRKYRITTDAMGNEIKRTDLGQSRELTPKEKMDLENYKYMIMLQDKERAGTITEQEKGALDKMRVGQPLVQIGMGQPPAPSERERIAEQRAAMDTLDNLKDLWQKTGKDTGPIWGRIAPTAGLVGKTTKEMEDLMAATAAFKNRIIKEITGAQLSAQEQDRILAQVPMITDPPARWESKWEQTMKNLEFITTRQKEVLRQSGIKVPEDKNLGVGALSDEALMEIIKGGK